MTAVITAGLLRAIPGQKVDPQVKRSKRHRRQRNRTGHDFEILHRTARPFQVIAILMILIGGVCLFRLAVAQYPDVVRRRCR